MPDLRPRRQPAIHHAPLCVVGLLIAGRLAAVEPDPDAGTGTDVAEPAVIEITGRSDALALDGIDAEGFAREADQRLHLDEAALRRDGVERLADLAAYDPRLTMVGDGRGGIADIRMRGLGGNRVAVTLDGIPLADDLAGRDYVDPLLLGGVEAVFGPGSSRYGSDALAGSLRLRSLHPDDLVDTDAPWYLLGRLAGSTLDEGIGLHARGAHAGASHAWLVAATGARRQQREAPGEAVIPAAEYETLSGLGALRLDLAARWRTTLTADGFDQRVDSVFADEALLRSSGDDEHQRARLALDLEAGDARDPWLRSGIYAQRTTSVERTTDQDLALSPGIFNRTVTATNDFEQTVVGGHALLSLLPDDGSLLLGCDARLTTTEDLQTRRTEIASPPSSNEADPRRSFPLSDAVTGGVFAEYGRDLADGSWGVELGARVDVYLLDVEVDAAYERSLAGQNAPTDLEDAAPTGRVALLWRPTEAATAWAKLATGYRNGRYDEANQAFTNFTNGYTISPNPDLQPERSIGLELGARRSGQLSGEVVGHYTWYRDFIEQVFVGTVPNVPGIGPFATLAQYQSINRERVEIWGVDALGAAELGAGFSLRGALSWIDGEDVETGETIRELDPVSGFAGLAWTHEPWGLRLEGLIRAAGRKRGLEDDGSFVPEGWAVVDLRLAWTPSEHLRIDLAAINLFDRLYWRWSEVDDLVASDDQATKDFHAEDPRHLTAAITATF